MFLNPHHLSVGGITGACTLLHKYLGLPYTLTSTSLNLALLAWGIRVKGLAYVKRTVMAMLTLGILLDFPLPVLEQITPASQPVAMICGSILTGLGYGLIVSADTSTGESDLLAMIVIRHCPSVTVGMVMDALDLLVVLAGGIFSGLRSLLLSIVAVLLCNMMIDIAAFTFGDQTPVPSWLRHMNMKLDKQATQKFRGYALALLLLLIVVTSYYVLTGGIWHTPQFVQELP